MDKMKRDQVIFFAVVAALGLLWVMWMSWRAQARAW
jgi:hypothetical protein